MIGVEVATEILEAIEETGEAVLYDAAGNEITLILNGTLIQQLLGK